MVPLAPTLRPRGTVDRVGLSPSDRKRCRDHAYDARSVLACQIEGSSATDAQKRQMRETLAEMWRMVEAGIADDGRASVFPTLFDRIRKEPDDET
jgi:hypothetical protein